ncbi:MAG: hypothetical protein AB4352_29795 [Hormoscilla sp.]
MNNYQKFELQLAEPWVWPGLEPPDDPLGELDDLEISLRKFCFECNHKVAIGIAGEVKYVFLDPDIILILNELPEKISQLASGKKIEIDFPESWMIIEFVPAGGEVSCTLRKFGVGDRCQQMQFNLDLSQVLGVLKEFLDTVIQMARDKGYISHLAPFPIAGSGWQSIAS